MLEKTSITLSTALIKQDLIYIYWSFDPYIFHTPIFSLRWYSVFFAISVMLIYLIGVHIFSKEGYASSLLIQLIQYAFFGGFIGARLVHILFYDLAYFIEHPIAIFKIWEGGLASHGGLLGILVGISLFLRKYKQPPFWWILDRLSLALPFSGALIRLGNLFNSELVGLPSQKAWAFVFPLVDQQARHPSPLYEAIWMIITGSILWYIFVKSKRKPPKGLLTALLLLLGFIGRSILEVFKIKGDTPQMLNVPFIICGVCILIWSWQQMKSKKTKD